MKNKEKIGVRLQNRTPFYLHSYSSIIIPRILVISSSVTPIESK